MATQQQLETALRNAHAAGDTAAAKRLANALKSGQYASAAGVPRGTPAIPASSAQTGMTIAERAQAALAGQGDPIAMQAAQAARGVPVEQAFGPLEAAQVGAGRALTRIGRGAADLAGRAAGLSPEGPMLGGMRQREAEEAALYAPLAQERPISTLAGEIAPYLATAPLAGASLTGAAATGAGLGALEYQADPTDRLIAGAAGGAGGALGYGAGRVAGRLLGGRASQLEEPIERLAQRADDLGIRLTPAERTGSRGAQIIEANIESNPLTAGVLGKVRDANQTRLNSIAAQSIGLPAKTTKLTSEHLGQAAREIGEQFDDALAGQRVALDDTFLAALDSIEAQWRSTWNKSDAVAGLLADARAEALEKGVIPASRYKQLQTMLREQATSAFRSQAQDPELGRAIGAVKDALDDAAARGMGPEKMTQFRDAQAKYRALMNLEAAATDSGNISGPKLANTLRRKDVAGYRRGELGNDLYDAARLSKAFPREFGRSGTAERMSISNTLRDIGAGGGLGVLAGLGTPYIDPEAGALLGVTLPLLARGGAGMYASRLAQRGLAGPISGAAQRRGAAAAGLAGAGAVNPLMLSP